jgi:predicted DCC family thiol-disulfide oxidoreductase YuxK
VFSRQLFIQLDKKERRILLFDGMCNLCNGLILWIIKNEKTQRIKFASLQSDTGQGLLEHFNLSSVGFNSLIYIDGQDYYQKSTGVLKVLNDMGGVWKIFNFFYILPPSVRDWLYDRVAGNRYRWFGRRAACMTPSADIKARFL